MTLLRLHNFGVSFLLEKVIWFSFLYHIHLWRPCVCILAIVSQNTIVMRFKYTGGNNMRHLHMCKTEKLIWICQVILLSFSLHLFVFPRRIFFSVPLITQNSHSMTSKIIRWNCSDNIMLHKHGKHAELTTDATHWNANTKSFFKLFSVEAECFFFLSLLHACCRRCLLLKRQQKKNHILLKFHHETCAKRNKIK